MIMERPNILPADCKLASTLSAYSRVCGAVEGWFSMLQNLLAKHTNFMVENVILYSNSCTR